MPRIQQYEKAQINLPSPVRSAGTGLQLASEDTLTAPSRALGQVGSSLGKLGEIVYTRIEQHKDQDRKDSLNYASNVMEDELNVMKKELAEFQTPHEQLDYYEKKIKPWLKNKEQWGDDPNDLPDDPRYSGVKRNGWGDLGNYFKDKKKAFLSGESLKIAVSMAEVRQLRDEASAKEKNGRALSKQDGTEETYIAVGKDLKEYYTPQGNGKPKTWNDERLEEAEQVQAMGFLDKAFEVGNINIEVVNKYLKGKYKDALINIHKPNPNIIEEYDKKARMAKEDWQINTTVEEMTNAYILNPEGTAKKIMGDKTKDPKVKDKILLYLEKNLEQHEENINREQFQEGNRVSKMIREKQSVDKILAFVRNSKTFDDTQKLQYEEKLLKKDGDPFSKSDPVIKAEVRLGILFNPEEYTETKILSMLNTLPQNKGVGLHPDDVAVFTEKRRGLDKEKEKDTPFGRAIATLNTLRKENENAIKDSDDKDKAQQLIDNDSKFNDWAEELEKRVKDKKDTEESYKTLNEILKPHFENKSKGLLNRFWNSIKGNITIVPFGIFGIGADVEKKSEEIKKQIKAMPEDLKLPSDIKTTSQAVEWLKKEYKITDEAAIEWVRGQ